MDAENIQVLLVESGVRSERFSLGAGAHLRLAAFVLGAGEISVEVDLVGPGAEFELDGLFVVALPLDKADLRSERPSGKAREDFARERTNACVTEQNSSSNEASGPLSPQISVIVRHLAPDCTSRQLVKGIALGGSTAPVAGSFNGTIYVAREAQRTDAQQYNRNIIVGDGAVITTRPQMEIYADDVRCNHGATIGQLDDEAVFYMRQRGLSETEARHLLLQGFAHEITDRLSDNTLRDEIVSKIDSLIK